MVATPIAPLDPRAHLRGMICRRPFEMLEIHPSLNGFACCPSWLSRPVGNAERDTIMGIWNSQAMREIRASILDGSFQYCDAEVCPHIQARRLTPVGDALDLILAGSGDPTVVDGPPYELGLCYDLSCNLACPSCRTRRTRISSGPAHERLSRFTQEILALLDQYAGQYPTVLRLSGSGDPIASPVMLHLLRSIDHTRHSRLRIALQTNGQMLTERLWSKLEGAAPCLDSVSISIDAANERTYQAVRRHGSWRRLQENLQHLARRRAAGQLQSLSLNFVVQQANFQELPAFVRLAEDLGHVDEVFVTRALNWGSWTEDQYRAQCVWEPEHPDHQRFLEVLRAPELGREVVHLGNLYQSRVRAVENGGWS